MHGLGCGLLLPLIFSIPSQWTYKHRALATGIVVAGASLGGAIPSLIIQEMLTRMGFHKTMLIYSFVQGVVMLAGFLLIKTRMPASRSEVTKPRIQWIETRHFRDPVFWAFWFAILFAIFGYMNAFIYIAVYTHERLPQLPPRIYNLPITVMSFASVIGRTTVGFVADRIGSVNAFILVVFVSAFCQAVLWNIAASSYAGIMAFSILFGLSGPCFISLVTPVAATLYGIHNLATLTGTLNLANVPGILVLVHHYGAA
ncbi:hypothetical protein FRC09_013055 [Ceratobasidium sp. 395]|nr:hypothetical protein FRC09_013055 [Ceratobasidium sp. 395]